MKHSPAPWTWIEGYISKDTPVFTLVDGEENILILPMYEREIKKADAALIAAAPDLLEACQEAYGYMRLISDQHGYIELNGKRINPVELWNILRSAIAKATQPEPEQSKAK